MPSRNSFRRVLLAASAALSLVVGLGVAQAATGPVAAGCRQRILVLSAMPVEVGPILAQTKVSKTVTVDGREFYVGSLRGHDVVVAMTRIGPVNATAATKDALKTFRCGSRSGVSAVVFSGVAGGDWIGNVAVASRWTLDNGKTWLPVDKKMLATARTLETAKLPLEQKTPVGDPMCACVIDPSSVSTVAVGHKPQVEVGGNGQTTDPFGGRAIPCVPGGNDVFGCDPCPVAKHPTSDASAFPQGIKPFIGTGFFTGYLSSSGSSGKTKYVSEDEETAAVDNVATAHHIPFLGFRAVSDGGGDPLGLPGFPFQFFYYRVISADNAAITTMAFLAKWRG
jgi:nucleoside phosphorylase